MKFTAKKRFEREYNGDSVAYTLLAPDVKLMVDLQTFNKLNSDGVEVFTLENAPDVMDKLKGHITPFIEKLEITDAENNQITVEDLFRFPFFFGLVVEITKDIFSMGNLAVEDVKKSEGLSPELITEQVQG